MGQELVAVFDSALGWMAAAWIDTRVVALTFGHASPGDALGKLRSDVSEPTPPDLYMKRLIRRLRQRGQGYCGDNFDDVELDMTGMTEFQRAVNEQCRRIPVGETMSYGELADRAGHPRAARAVGRVMSSNRFPLIVPCHRVVASNSLGGFSSPDGLDMKRRLLSSEAAQINSKAGA